jgi:CelD/BcsL family acetyltransferase involved in cellulose biosynthesis
MNAPHSSNYSELDRPDSLLNRLAKSYAPQDPLCSRSEWILSFHEAFNPDRTLHIRSTDHSMVAFASWEHEDYGTILEPLESHWLFSNPLLGAHSIELLRSLLNENPDGIGDALLVLSGLEMGTPLLNSVVKAFNRTHTIRHLRSTIFRSASLAGGPDGFLSRRSPKFRNNLRRAIRLSRERGVQFEQARPMSMPEADRAFDRMLRIEEQSWKGIEKCGMAESPSKEFYRLLFRRLASGGLARAIFATADGKDVGFVMGGIDGTHYRGQQFSFVHDWGRESIGNLLQWEQIQSLCHEGIERYDMGSVLEYKVRWTEIEIQTESIVLHPRIRRPREPRA